VTASAPKGTNNELKMVHAVPAACPWCKNRRKNDWIYWRCWCGFQLFTCPDCTAPDGHQKIVTAHQRTHPHQRPLSAKDRARRERERAHEFAGLERERERELARREKKREKAREQAREAAERAAQMDQQARGWLEARRVIVPRDPWTSGSVDPLMSASFMGPVEEFEPTWPDQPGGLDLVQTIEFMIEGRRF